MGDAIWKGLFEWSIRQQDGTRQSDGPKPMSETDRKWLEEAIASRTIDLNARMKEIKGKLDAERELSLSDKEALLDELLDIVDHIDLSRDLQTIGGLPTLLALLESPEPSLRSRAAEVVATCAQNNPPVQKMMVEGGTLPKLLSLLHDEVPAVVAKALLALSCCVRGQEEVLDRFRALGGTRALLRPAGSADPRMQRKALQLLQHVLRARLLDLPDCLSAGLLGCVAAAVAGGDEDTREAGLGVLQGIAHVAEARPLIQQAADLQAALAGARQAVGGLAGEEAAAAAETRSLLEGIDAALAAPPSVSVVMEAGGGGQQMVLIMKKP